MINVPTCQYSKIATTPASIPRTTQRTNEIHRESQAFLSLSPNLPNQKPKWRSNEQIAARRVGQPLKRSKLWQQSQQQMKFTEQQHQSRVLRPPLLPNIVTAAQQDGNSQIRNLNVKSNSQSDELLADWVQVPLHAPHRALLSGGGCTSISLREAKQSAVP